MWGGFAAEAAAPQRRCMKCPKNAVCTSSGASVESGFSLFPMTTRRAMGVGGWSTAACPNKIACPSHHISAGNIPDNSCKVGYARPEYGCTVCDDGYGMKSDPLVCQLCPDLSGRMLSLLLLIAIESVPVAWSLKVARTMGMQVYEGSTVVSPASALLKMFLTFTTILRVYLGSPDPNHT